MRSLSIRLKTVIRCSSTTETRSGQRGRPALAPPHTSVSLHALHHQDYVAAPVLGNPDLARTRELFVLAAGPHSALEKARSLLEDLGRRLFVIDEDAGLANLVKLAENVLTATTLECMGEVLALIRKSGIDRHVAYDVLTNSLFDSRVQTVLLDDPVGPDAVYQGVFANDGPCGLDQRHRTSNARPPSSTGRPSARSARRCGKTL